MEVLVALLLVLAPIVGWVFGIIGFFRAGRALREIQDLRAALAAATARADGAVTVPSPSSAGAMRSVEAIPMPPDALVMPSEAVTGPEISEGPAEPPPSLVVEQAAPRRSATDLEALLTMRWGLWLGALALLMAGVFLIRYAVDAGIFGPAARCVAAAALGVALVGGGEWLRRRPPPRPPQADPANSGIDDPAMDDPWTSDLAPSALAAGGVGVLFGAAYGAGPFYGLLPPVAAFVLLASAGLAGLAASLRFGQLVAAIGVACSFVTPLLVHTNAPSLPGLFGYLFVVTAAALAVVRFTAWTWLGWTTIVAGAAWALVGTAAAGRADIWAPSWFVPATAALNLALLPRAALDHEEGRRLSWIPFAALGGAGLLLEASSASAWPRIGVLLLVPLAVAKGMFEPRLDRLPWLASLLFLLSLLLWALPEWQPTGEAITVNGVIEALLPGAWAPAVIVPLLLTAAGVASFLSIAGFLLERRAPNPLRWTALVAAVPVLTLAVTYVQVERFQPDIAWAFAALALTAALVGTTTLAAREGATQRAGAHAAGAVAALALACAMLLHEHWLTLAVALFLPPLAWIEARADLPALRRVALVVAGLVLIRLLLNWYVIDYAYGATPVLNGLLAAYGVPAASFALAARMFRRRADDLTVAVLESGAVAFFSVLVAMEIRHLESGGDLRAPGSFDEAAFHVAAMGAQALGNLLLWRRTGRKVLGWAWRIQGMLALLGGVGLLLGNPLIWGDPADTITLLAGYLVPALLASAALRYVPAGGVSTTLGVYAVVAGLAWVGLEVRALFHPGALGLDQAPLEDAELWAWSGTGLLYGAGLLALGIRTGGQALRMAALAIIGLVSAKVFLIDMAGLEGLWRVVSFLGLGLMLIALGAIYRRFVLPRREAG